ncbi:MAG: amidohydrolase [Nitrospirota bacterium]|nr:amidohydrolase [Nitrospirota bacterium]
MKSVDLIVKADYVLTMNQDLAVIEGGAIAIKDSKIAAVDTAAQITQNYSASKIIKGEGKVAFPGLVNTHTHAAMVYFRGLADDLPLKVWLEEHIWPAEAKWLSPEFVGDAVELACLEMLKAGITTYTDMYFFGDAVAQSTRKIGMRAVVGSGIVDFPTATGSNADDYLAHAEQFIKKWKGDELIVPSIADHSAYACSPETLKKSKALADRHDVLLQIHLSETEWEVNEILSRYGRRPVAHLDALGLLDERLITAHCVWLEPDEITMLAKSKTSVSHCIESNLKLASGIAPVVKMLNAGVRVSFGTDGAASNNDLSILSEMSTAAKVHKALSGDPTALSAKQALLMGTRHGAEAIGLGSLCGSLEKGKSADIALADLNRPHLIPLYDIYSHIVYSMNAADIDTVLVNGKIVLEGRKLVTADEAEIMAKAVQWGNKIKRANSHS